MNSDIDVPGLDSTQSRLMEIFFPHEFQRTLEALNARRRFVYYTTADTAISIIRNREVWMRKTSLMNDYREIEHGFDCLNAAYKKHSESLKVVLNGMFPDFCDKLEKKFNAWLPSFRLDTYIACVSEHDDSEDRHGRLSMWRAYGGIAGVALVVNAGPFLRPSQALKVFSSPIAYRTDEGFDREFTTIVETIGSNDGFLKSVGEEVVLNYMFSAFRYSILCTKHPGFHEEREWRVIYSPSYQKSERVSSAIESINGTPQSICKIPLKDVPEENLIGLNLSEFIDRVIIGPARFPLGIYDALFAVLTEAGVQDVTNKLIVSDLPLRH